MDEVPMDEPPIETPPDEQPMIEEETIEGDTTLEEDGTIDEEDPRRGRRTAALTAAKAKEAG